MVGTPPQVVLDQELYEKQYHPETELLLARVAGTWMAGFVARMGAPERSLLLTL